MRKSRKFLVVAAVIFVFALTSASAALYQNINNNAKILGGWYEMPEIIKETTTTNSSVSLDSLGGASALLFKARGKWWNGSKWIQDPYGPNATVTATGTLNIIWFTKDFSASMPMNVAFRNNAINLTTPRVIGVWNHR